MNQELNQSMRPFRARLTAEAVLRAAAVSGVFVLPVWLILALVKRVFNLGSAQQPVWMLLAWAVLFAALLILGPRRSR